MKKKQKRARQRLRHAGISHPVSLLLTSAHTVVAQVLTAEEVDSIDSGTSFDTDGTACIGNTNTAMKI